MKASAITVKQFIGEQNKVFMVPPFQRNYDWDEKHCNELFLDIENAAEHNIEHYIGNIVFYESRESGSGNRQYVLIDGQQRVTTIILLLCAIRDCCDSESLKNEIFSKYLINDTADVKYRIKLKQTTYDDESFISIVNGKLENIAKDNNHICKNYRHFCGLLKGSEFKPELIYDTILTKLQMVEVNLEINNDLSRIQTVFEKINSTGKTLSYADLIRNYLLLANSFDKQKELYENYWVKIERIIQRNDFNTTSKDYISKFARDFIILHTFRDFKDEATYKMFKKNFDFDNGKELREDVLSEMLGYSEYYSWLLFENCENFEINKTIKYLNLLKADDSRPLLMFLFKELYLSNRNELFKILDLISDFFIRYRIVAPYRGGSSLRNIIYRILRKLVSNEIELNYESILRQLSDHSAWTERFPDDEEFKKALMGDVDVRYARVALIKLEEKERRNISVDINQVTIEHFMPQSLTPWWVKHLGGKKEADRIKREYMNCIGNLGPMSRAYNSENSNHPWDEKVAVYKQVQFVLTSSVAKYIKWTEEEIVKRNKNVAERLCNAITRPLPNSNTTDLNKDLNVKGIYRFDEEPNYIYTKPIALFYNGTTHSVRSWRDIIMLVCEICYDKNPQNFISMVKANYIHRTTYLPNTIKKKPILSFDSEELNKAERIKSSNIFVDTNLGANDIVKYCLKIIEFSDDINNFKFKI